MKLKLLTLAIAVAITAVLYFTAVDLVRPFTAFFNGAGIASGSAAVVSGFVTATLIWWLIVYLIATRVTSQPSGGKS